MIIIYKLTSPNGKVYIGQTKNSQKRFSAYKHERCKRQPKLYNSIRKYKWKNFTKEILEYSSEEFADDYEVYYIKKYNCVDDGLNLQYGGHKTKTYSPEARMRMRNSHLGKASGNKGKTGGTSWNKGLKDAQIPYIRNEETKKKLITSIKKNWKLRKERELP